ncbi:A/G-specific adenine glycosylase [bacterium]|nr:MAG: A/G-specific adenine glycosylase [bacterium]
MALFQHQLLNWFTKNQRSLPWRDNRTAWFTLLSEVMLQQTRVDQALPYFLKFTQHYPTIQDFAKADRDEILLLWEGLGYYSRARNLYETAQIIVRDFDGNIPNDYQTLLSIKGIGPYTAAAIASQVFNQVYAVVDGNVIRVLSRFFGLTDDVTKSKTKKQIQELADTLIDSKNPGEFNEAIMELGATICKPKNPICETCPISSQCMAFSTLQTDSIPYKAPKKKVPHHHIGIGVIANHEGKILIAKRPDDKMLGGLWEFPGGKQEIGETIEETIIREFDEEIGVHIELHYPYPIIKHAYSHFKISLHSWKGILISGVPQAKESSEIKWIWPDELANYAFPKANRKLIDYILTEQK